MRTRVTRHETAVMLYKRRAHTSAAPPHTAVPPHSHVKFSPCLNTLPRQFLATKIHDFRGLETLTTQAHSALALYHGGSPVSLTCICTYKTPSNFPAHNHSSFSGRWSQMCPAKGIRIPDPHPSSPHPCHNIILFRSLSRGCGTLHYAHTSPKSSVPPTHSYAWLLPTVPPGGPRHPPAAGPPQESMAQ